MLLERWLTQESPPARGQGKRRDRPCPRAFFISREIVRQQTHMGSQFENLMQSGNELLDEYFDEPLVLRAKGLAIALQGTIIPGRGDEESEKDYAQTESWLEITIQLHAADLVANGQPFEITGGMEIARAMPNGKQKIYILTRGPGGLWWEPLDVDETRIIAFGKFQRYE